MEREKSRAKKTPLKNGLTTISLKMKSIHSVLKEKCSKKLLVSGLQKNRNFANKSIPLKNIKTENAEYEDTGTWIF